MEVFLTITSPVFSELVIILQEMDITYFRHGVPMFEILRKMYEVKPFKLVFWPEVSDSLQGEVQQKLEGSLNLVTTEGLLDFLDSPPTIRIARSRQSRWISPFPEFD